MKKSLPIFLVLFLVIVGCGKQERPATDTTASAATATSATATATASAPAAEATATGIEVGSLLPAYTSEYLNGGAYDPAAKRGTVQLVNVWATWCGPCRYEIPELQALHDRFQPRGFEVIGVSVDETGADGVRRFVEDQKMTYPIVLDEKGTLADLLQTSVLPTTVLLDREGKIVWKKYGAIMQGDKELEGAIEAALDAGRA